MKRFIRADNYNPIVLKSELFYDTVSNIENAGWDDILAFFHDNGWVSGRALIIPEGTSLTVTGRDATHTYLDVKGPKSSIEIPLLHEDMDELKRTDV